MYMTEPLLSGSQLLLLASLVFNPELQHLFSYTSVQSPELRDLREKKLLRGHLGPAVAGQGGGREGSVSKDTVSVNKVHRTLKAAYLTRRALYRRNIWQIYTLNTSLRVADIFGSSQILSRKTVRGQQLLSVTGSKVAWHWLSNQRGCGEGAGIHSPERMGRNFREISPFPCTDL